MTTSNLPVTCVEEQKNIPTPTLPRDPVEQWATTWTERFRLDAAEVDGEVHALCDKIRGLLDAIEKREA